MTMTPVAPISVELGHWGLIRARGADAASFLHGQLTQDVLHLPPTEARLAGYCSAKGRLLASFVMCSPSPDEVLLACHASVLPATLKRLAMFVMRAKCQLSDATSEFEMVGLAGEPALEAVGDLPIWGRAEQQGAACIRLPDASGRVRALRLAERGQGGELSPKADAAGLMAWRGLEVESAVAVIEAATVDQFVPQMLNFELIGAVNFQKGCYPGQEVVARSQYRGTAKRRALLFECDAQASAAQEVFHDRDASQPAGMVVNAANVMASGMAGLPCRALVEVKLSALGDGELHLGAPDGPVLARCAMPYDVPTDTEGSSSGVAT
jgi:folate-binding protein YgfZ